MIKPNALKIEIGSQNQVKNKINFAKNYHENKNLQKWKVLPAYKRLSKSNGCT